MTEAPTDCYKTEADTLRRIVMEALAERTEVHPDPRHWSNRAREMFGVDGQSAQA